MAPNPCNRAKRLSIDLTGDTGCPFFGLQPDESINATLRRSRRVTVPVGSAVPVHLDGRTNFDGDILMKPYLHSRPSSEFAVPCTVVSCSRGNFVTFVLNLPDCDLHLHTGTVMGECTTTSQPAVLATIQVTHSSFSKNCQINGDDIVASAAFALNTSRQETT